MGFSAQDTSGPSAFRLEESQDKGKILVSKRSFSEGEVVFSEKPVWQLRHRPASESPLPVSQQDIVDSFYAMPQGQRAKILRLYCLPEERSQLRYTFGATGEQLDKQLQLPAEASQEEVWRLLRIVEANKVPLDGLGFTAVFAHPSRMSHSCAPNAAIRFGPKCEVYALQAIKAGDELTHSYLTSGDLAAPRLQRQATLYQNWDFLCRCPRCLADEAAEDRAKAERAEEDDGLFQAVLEDDAEAARRILARSGGMHPDSLRPAVDKRQILSFKAGAQTRPLWMAARLGHAAAARALLEAGAGGEGLKERALQAAAAGGHAEVLELLLAHGADPAAVAADGTSALAAAEAAGHGAAAAVLRKAAAAAAT